MKKFTSIAASLCLATAFCGLCTGCANNIKVNNTLNNNPDVIASADASTDYKVILNPGRWFNGSTETQNSIEEAGTSVTKADGDTYYTDNGYICTVSAGADLPKATTTRTGMTFVGWRYADGGVLKYQEKMPSQANMTGNLYLYAEWKTASGSIVTPPGPVDPPGPGPVDPVDNTKIMSIGGTVANIAFTSKPKSEMPSNQTAEYYATGVSLTAGNVLSFKVDGQSVNLEIEEGVTAVTGSGSSVTVADTATGYTVSIKKYDDNDNWIIWVGVPVVSDTSYVAVSGSDAYIVGKFAGTNTEFTMDNGFKMNKNPTNANEWMFTGLQLTAGDTFVIRLGTSDTTGHSNVKSGVTVNYTVSGGRITINKTGSYDFYYDINAGLWIA